MSGTLKLQRDVSSLLDQLMPTLPMEPEVGVEVGEGEEEVELVGVGDGLAAGVSVGEELSVGEGLEGGV